MTNPRVRKVADRIQVIVAEMLERRIKDPRLGFVTVTDVRVTGDTQQATIFYTVLGEDEQLAGTAAALESAKGLIRSEVGKQLGMRHVPTLDVHPRRPAGDRPAPRGGAGAGPGQPTRPSPRAPAGRRTPARPTRTASRTRTTTLDDEPRRRARSRTPSTRRLRHVPIRAGRRRQAGRDDLARRRRPGPPARRHPQGRPRRHARPDGHRRAAARRRTAPPGCSAT